MNLTMEAACRRHVSWPMYAVDPSAVARFWVDLHAAMLAAHVAGVPDDLDHPVDLAASWRDPALLLGHTCGYPFAKDLRGEVRYVGTPRFRVEGCTSGFYRSAIMVRNHEAADTLADLADRRVAYNARDSQSGYNGLRALAAGLARGNRFFSSVLETGSHRNSLSALRNGLVDVAAIDVVTLALVRRHAPGEIEGLREIGYTKLVPGLPLITSRLTNDDQLARLRRACAAACAPTRPAAADMLLDGLEIFEERDYDLIAGMERHAEALGYPVLA